MLTTLRRCGVVFLLLCWTASATATDLFSSHSNQPVRIVVPFGAGSASDTVARLIAAQIPESFGTAIVENKPGAGGTIGAGIVAKAKPDGLTFLLTSSSTHSGIQALFRNPGYDPIKDFTHVSEIATVPLLLVVRADTPYHSIADLVEAARIKHLRFAYGNGSSQIATFTFNSVSAITSDAIPYKSQPQAVIDLLGGQVDYMLADSSVVTSFLESGRLRALAITGEARASMYPEVPTLKESGYGDFNLVVWVGLAAPAGLSPTVAESWNKELRKVLARPDVIERLTVLGMVPVSNTVAEHADFVAQQRRVWTERAAKAGVAPQ